MRVSVIADFVIVRQFAFDQLGVVLSVRADDEEGRRHMLAAKDIEDKGGVFRIGSVVEGEGDLSILRGSKTLDHARRGKFLVTLIGDQAALGFIRDVAASVPMGGGDFVDLAFAREIHAILERHRGEVGRRFGR